LPFPDLLRGWPGRLCEVKPQDNIGHSGFRFQSPAKKLRGGAMEAAAVR
jgi:hypothetical protein